MCNKSDSITKIAAALVAFSGEVKSIEKDATNPHFKSAYTTLDHMIDETKPLLHKHGLTVMQFPGGDGQKITVRTMILHSSGEWIETEPLTVNAVKTDPQGAGSAITYARRYSYAAALSLSLGDDDDGNSSSYTPQRAAQTTQERPAYQNTQNRTQPNTGQSSASGNAKKQALDFMPQLGWSWNEISKFATEVLKRPVNRIVQDVKNDGEWKLIYEGMVYYQRHGSMPVLDEMPGEQTLPF